MITTNLFNEVLVNPALENDANELYIVSGYATAAMATRHFERLQEIETEISIHLIIGMTVQDGLSEGNHQAFKQLMENQFPGLFECSYTTTLPPVHSKVYTWVQNGQPVAGFLGSANYSQKAFWRHQREIMSVCNAEQSFEYFQSLTQDTIYCTHPEAEGFVQIFNDEYLNRRQRIQTQQEDTIQASIAPEIQGLEHVRVSFIDRYGEISRRSGLNWGQRSQREPNQAYIPLKATVYRTDFFPPIAQHFTVYTDDNKILICSRAQQQGKAIHTPLNNSHLGEYFRRRLGVPNGQMVTMEHFEAYGKTYVDFYKIDEETYFMDFSRPQDG